MIEPFAAVEIIAAKRDRNELTDPQIDWVIDAYTRGVVADEQMSALAMAILCLCPPLNWCGYRFAASTGSPTCIKRSATLAFCSNLLCVP